MRNWILAIQLVFINQLVYSFISTHIFSFGVMLVNGMIIVGDGYIDDDCGHHGVCAMRPARDDENAVKRAVISAKRMVEVCRATEGIRNGVIVC